MLASRMRPELNFSSGEGNPLLLEESSGCKWVQDSDIKMILISLQSEVTHRERAPPPREDDRDLTRRKQSSK